MSQRTGFLLPLWLVLLGLGGLAWQFGWINFEALFWPMLLAIGGISVFALRGFNTQSFVAGAGLCVAACLEWLRHTQDWRTGIFWSCLLIALGLLVALNRSGLIPVETKTTHKHTS